MEPTEVRDFFGKQIEIIFREDVDYEGNYEIKYCKCGVSLNIDGEKFYGNAYGRIDDLGSIDDCKEATYQEAIDNLKKKLEYDAGNNKINSINNKILDLKSELEKVTRRQAIIKTFLNK